MDNERRGSISDGSKWGKDYSSEDIMSKDEAYKAVYADVPDQGKADADDAPEDEMNVVDAADAENMSDEEEADVSEPAGEAEDADKEEPDSEEANVSEPESESEDSGKVEADAEDTEASEPEDEADDVFNDWVEDFSEEVNDGEPELTEEQESSGEPGLTEESETTEESVQTEASKPADESDQTEEPEQTEEPGSTVEPVPGGEDPVPIDPEKLKKRRMLIGGIAGLCIVALIAGSQIHKHYKEFYTTHFFNGTVINGEDASKKTVEEVKDDIKLNVSHYALKIKELDRNEKITAQDVGLEYVDDGKIDELMEEQEEGKWFLHRIDFSQCCFKLCLYGLCL